MFVSSRKKKFTTTAAILGYPHCVSTQPSGLEGEHIGCRIDMMTGQYQSVYSGIITVVEVESITKRHLAEHTILYLYIYIHIDMTIFNVCILDIWFEEVTVCPVC